MIDMNNLPKQKHEDLTKILDWIIIVFFAVFFILSLLPYYSVSKGEEVTSRGYSITASEDDSWTLLGYVGFPYNHTSVEEWQADMYAQNKDIITANNDNKYKHVFKKTLGRWGVKFGGVAYQDLAVPGITTKTVSIKQVGPILFLDIFALIGIAWLIRGHGSARPVYCFLWTIFGFLGFGINYLLRMGTTWVRPVMIVVVAILCALAIVDSVLTIMDGRSRSAYLKSVSAAYA